ncbi:MAG: HNH endonuclease [Candidatus Heimdallarchaeaceae archaeon]
MEESKSLQIIFSDLFYSIVDEKINSEQEVSELLEKTGLWEERVAGVPEILVLFLEYCFSSAKDIHSDDYPAMKSVLTKLMCWFPLLRRLLFQTSEDAIGNILLGSRGRLKFNISSREELDIFLKDWAEIGIKKVRAENVFYAIISKPTIEHKIVNQNIKLKILLHHFFPELSSKILELNLTDEEMRDYDNYLKIQKIKPQPISRDSLTEEIKRQNYFVKFKVRRNKTLARLLKIKHNHKCQICKARGKEPEDGKEGALKVEAHHIVPLGEGGADISSNIIIVCSEHHRMLEKGELLVSTIDDDKIEISMDKDKIIVERN